MSQPEAGAPERTRVALVNDYEIVLRGLEAMLRPFADRIDVVELDVERNPDSVVDVALFDTYGHPRLGLDRIASLANDPHVGAVAVYTWSFTAERFDAARAAARAACSRSRCRPKRSSTRSNRSRTSEEFVSAHFGRTVRQPWPGHDLGLTLRESEVALFLAQGLRNRDIASGAVGQREHGEDASQVDLPEDGGDIARRGDRAHLARRELQSETARLPRRRRSRRSVRSEARIPSADVREMLVFGARSEQDREPMKTSELSAHERALIDFEREWWQLGSRKDVGDPRPLRDVGEQLLPRAARAHRSCRGDAATTR